MLSNLTRYTLHMHIVASATFLIASSVQAAEPKWSSEAYNFIVIDQDIRDTLLEFGRNNDMLISLSKSVKGRVRGKLPSLTPEKFLSRITEDNGLTWYYDGALLHVSASSENATETFVPASGSPSQALTKLKDSHVLDDRFSVRAAADGVSLAVAGPPAFRQAVIQAVNVLQPQSVSTVRVFRGGKSPS